MLNSLRYLAEFFTADMVFLRFDENDEIADMIIGEIKLSGQTALSSGQRLAAMAAIENGSLAVRSATRTEDHDLQALIQNLTQGANVPNVNFIKIFGDGTGNFQDIVSTVY